MNTNKKILLTVIFPLMFFCASVQALAGIAEKSGWAPATEAALNDLINKNSGVKGAYAVFDWDNTSILGDVQETMLYYQIEHLAFKITPDEFKYALYHYADPDSQRNCLIPDIELAKGFYNSQNQPVMFSAAAEDCYNDYKYLYGRYHKINPAAKFNISLSELKKTDEFLDFRAKLWFTYSALYKTFPSQVAYTWIMFVTAQGFTEKEYKRMAQQGLDWGLKRDCNKVYFESPASLPGKSGVINNRLINNYITNAVKTQPETGGLFGRLLKNKIDVYISTASMQSLVEVIAEIPKYGYKLSKGHVLGLRLKKDKSGKFLPQYDFSGGYAINGNEGKTININNLLASKFKANPVMIAGDSDGDFYMMTELGGINGAKIPNEYKPLQLVLIMNRLKKGNIGGLCKIAAEQLKTGAIEGVRIVLQGRNENTGKFIPTEKTILLGEPEENAALLP